MEHINLFWTSAGWMATFTDPAVQAAFGTDTIPTAFTAAAKPQVVLAGIQRLNPGADVRMHHTDFCRA